MEERDLREIVSEYRPPERREVVESYARALPASMRPAPAPVPTSRRRRKRGLLIFLAVLLVAAILAGVSFWLSSQRPVRQDPWQPSEDAQPAEITIPTHPWGQGVTLPLEEAHGEELTIQEVYQKVNPSVVLVSAQLKDGVSMGTGVIFTTDGYVLTNYHVIEGGQDCAITLDTGYTYAAKYVAGDRDRDLAVLKTDETGLPAAEFGNSDDLTVGDTVYAIGNPLGYELRGTLTDGIVSAINRDVVVNDKVMTLIQTNAALNFGNSGGPLINVYGQVIGINTIKMGSEFSSIEGLGFAIPSVSVEYMVGDLLTYGALQPEPVLGITVGTLPITTADGHVGLEVFTVTPGTPAGRLDIREGDVLLTAGDEPLDSSDELLQVRNRCQIGDELTITLWRDGEILEFTLLLDQEATE